MPSGPETRSTMRLAGTSTRRPWWRTRDGEHARIVRGPPPSGRVAGMPLIAMILPMSTVRSVATVVAPGSHPFELAVACEVFGLDRPELGVPWYRFLVCAGAPRVDLGPFTLETEHGLDALAGADTVIVPACDPDLGPDARAHRRAARRVRPRRAAGRRSAAARSRSRPPARSTAAASRRTGCTRHASRPSTRASTCNPTSCTSTTVKCSRPPARPPAIDLSLHIVRRTTAPRSRTTSRAAWSFPHIATAARRSSSIQPVPDAGEPTPSDRRSTGSSTTSIVR